MLTKIIEFSIKNKLIIGLFIIGLIGFGIYETTKLPIDAVPDITDNQVQVITITPALGAPDVERLITFPIEQVNSNIPGLKEIRSFSRFGLSVVTIVFNDETDVYWARQQVTERLQQVQEAETKLAAHRGGGIVAVSAEDVAAAEQVRACLWGTRCLPGLSCPGHRMQTLKGPVHACPDPACILSLQRSWC